MARRYVADLSLALINRTGAYHVCRDLVRGLPEAFSDTRYWRLRQGREPQGLFRRVLAKIMLFELSSPFLGRRLPSWDRTRARSQPTLFLDPLYVLRARLDADDIVLCHDVGPVSMPHLFERTTTELYKEAYRRIEGARPGMVFVSETSRQAFVERYGTDYRFLEVIPLYVRSRLDEDETRAPPGVTRPFLLTVAALEIRKNYLRTIEAFNRSGLPERGYSYVFCGPKANQARDIEALANRSPGVVNLGFLSDAELRWLYRNASGFVLPSLLEGFGLPALEAAQHGLLSVISHDGALREAVGDAAILVDPLEPDDIASGMRAMVDMPAPERSKRLTIAKRHAADLTFERYIARWSELLAAR